MEILRSDLKAAEAVREDISAEVIQKISIKVISGALVINDLPHLVNSVRQGVRWKITDYLRKSKREQLMADVPDSAAPDPADDLDCELLLAATKLPPPQPEILRLHYQEELSLRDIATRLGLNFSAVQRAHQRALQTLRTLFLK